MVRYANPLEGILLAHEFGHNKGRFHRNGIRNLMHPSIGSSRVGVNEAECNAFRGLGQMQAQPAVVPGQNQVQPAADTLEAIREHYPHGFPVSVGLNLPSEDAEKVADLLVDETEMQWWPNALAALGLMGADISFETIRSFIERQNADTFSNPFVFRALATAPIALGYYVNVTGDKEALDYIIKSATPNRVLENSQFNAMISGNRDEAETLSGSFVAALSLAVTEDDTALEALSGLPSDSGDFQAVVSSQTEEANTEYRKVKELGLEAYSNQSSQ